MNRNSRSQQRQPLPPPQRSKFSPLHLTSSDRNNRLAQQQQHVRSYTSRPRSTTPVWSHSANIDTPSDDLHIGNIGIAVQEDDSRTGGLDDSFFDNPSVWDAIEQAEKQHAIEKQRMSHLASTPDPAPYTETATINSNAIANTASSNVRTALDNDNNAFSYTTMTNTVSSRNTTDTSTTTAVTGAAAAVVVEDGNSSNGISGIRNIRSGNSSNGSGSAMGVGRQRRINLFGEPYDPNDFSAFGNNHNSTGSSMQSVSTSSHAFNNRFAYMVNNRQNMALRRAVYRQTKFLNSRFPPISKELACTWIYPSSPPVRQYQKNITKRALFYNTLVCLPTGLGKTLIAAVVMYNYYRWFPTGKIIFMAPTKPLVDQQMTACYKVMGIPEDDTVQLTGNVVKTKRAQHWKTKRVFFATPQVVYNDLQTGLCQPTDIVLLVFDEAHRAQSNYSYCTIMRNVVEVNDQFRVLALSASPGKNIDAVQRVIDNLQIAVLEIREEEDHDVKEYMIAKHQGTQVVDLSKDIESLRDMLATFMKGPLDRLFKLKILFTQNPLEIYRSRIEQARQAIRAGNLPQAEKNKLMVGSDLSLLLSLSHGMSLLLTNGPKSFLDFLEQCQVEVQNNGRLIGKRQFVRSNVFEALLRKTRAMVQNKRTHPKIPILVEMVKRHLIQAREEEGRNSRVIVFAQYRQTVEEIVEALSLHSPLVKAMQFVGQGKQRSGRGLTQKDQLAVIESFKKNDYNVLVSTSVGEEGLDIGEVDLVVCYDVSVSPIRMIQRMGRTGRKREGNTIILLTRGIEDNILKLSQANKEKVFKDIKNAISDTDDSNGGRLGKKTLLLKFDDNNRMVPDDIKPKFKLSEMHIAKIRSNFNAISPSKRDGRKKPRQRQNQLITAPEQLYLKRSYGEIDLDKPFFTDFFASMGKSSTLLYGQSSFDVVYNITHSSLSRMYVRWMDAVEQRLLSDVIVKENMSTMASPTQCIDSSIRRMRTLRKEKRLESRDNPSEMLVTEDDEDNSMPVILDFDEPRELEESQVEIQEGEQEANPFEDDGYLDAYNGDAIMSQPARHIEESNNSRESDNVDMQETTALSFNSQLSEILGSVGMNMDMEQQLHLQKEQKNFDKPPHGVHCIISNAQSDSSLPPPNESELCYNSVGPVPQKAVWHHRKNRGSSSPELEIRIDDHFLQNIDKVGDGSNFVEYFPFGSKMLKRPRPLSERQRLVLEVIQSISPAFGVEDGIRRDKPGRMEGKCRASKSNVVSNFSSDGKTPQTGVPLRSDLNSSQGVEIDESHVQHNKHHGYLGISSQPLTNPSKIQASPVIAESDSQTIVIDLDDSTVSVADHTMQERTESIFEIDSIVPAIDTGINYHDEVLDSPAPMSPEQSPVIVQRRRLKKTRHLKEKSHSATKERVDGQSTKTVRQKSSTRNKQNKRRAEMFLDNEAEESSEEESDVELRGNIVMRKKFKRLRRRRRDKEEEEEEEEEENMYELNSSFIDDGPIGSSNRGYSQMTTPVSSSSNHKDSLFNMQAVYAQSVLSSPSVSNLRFRSPPKGRLAGKKGMALNFDKYLDSKDTALIPSDDEGEDSEDTDARSGQEESSSDDEEDFCFDDD